MHLNSVSQQERGPNSEYEIKNIGKHSWGIPGSLFGNKYLQWRFVEENIVQLISVVQPIHVELLRNGPIDRVLKVQAVCLSNLDFDLSNNALGLRKTNTNNQTNQHYDGLF